MSHHRRIYIKDAIGNVSNRLINDTSELDLLRNTTFKVAISPGVFDGKRMKSRNVVALPEAALDLDANTDDGFLTADQVKVLLDRIPSAFAPYARVIYSNGITLWFHFSSPCSTKLWPALVHGLVKLAGQITDGLPWVDFDRGTLVRQDGTPAKRQNAVFRYHPSYADRRGAMTEQVRDGSPMDPQLLIGFGEGYKIPSFSSAKTPKQSGGLRAGTARGSLKSQTVFIAAVTHYIQTSCAEATLVAKFGITRKEAGKIVGYRGILDRKLGRKVLHHHRTTLPLLPKAELEEMKPLTRSQRYAQKSFHALGYLGWFYFYLGEAGLTIDQGWYRLLYDDALAPLRRVVVRHWTVAHVKTDHAVWQALYGSRKLRPISPTLTVAAEATLKHDPTMSIRRLAANLEVSVTHAHRIKRAWVASTGVAPTAT